MVRAEESATDATPGALAHSIGEAARLVGVSRGLLRVWENEGLITPHRTPGGHRLYSGEDIRRLRQIQRLRQVDKLNVAAIRRVMGSDAPPQPVGTTDSGVLGQRLRALRSDRGLSLADVADRSGLSISFLSAVERGQSSISVGNLFRVADAYGTTLPALGSAPSSNGRSILHRHERARYTAGAGRVLIEDLIGHPGALEAQHMEILPGGGSEEAYSHHGVELIYLLSGELNFVIAEEEHHILIPGDSLYFQSQLLHRWWNEGDEPVNLIWVNVPQVDPAVPPDPRHRASRRGRRKASRAPRAPDQEE